MTQTNFFGTNNIIYTILVPSSFLILLLCWTFISNSGDEFLLSGSAINQINKNLHLAPIQNILLSSEECPSDYETATLGKWGGSSDGCSSSVGRPTTYCSIYNIQKIRPFSLSKWKDNSNFCIQRLAEFAYSSQCEPGFRKCSPNLCVKSNQECPITQVKFDDENSLQVSRNIGEQPLIAIEFSYYGKPCLAHDFAQIKNSPYPLLKQKYGCGKYGMDKNTMVLDSQPEMDFYQNNQMDWILSRLKKYSHSIEGDQVRLISRQRPQVDSSPICHNLELVNFPVNDLENVLTHQNAWVILILVFEFLLLLVATMFGCSLVRKDRESVLEFFSIFNIIAVSIVVSVTIVWVVVLYFTTVTDLQNFIHIKEQFNSVQASQCFINSPQINQAVSDFDKSINSLPETFYSATTYLLYITLLRWFLSILALFFKKSYL